MIQTPVNMDVENDPGLIKCQGTSIPRANGDPSCSLSISNPRPTDISSSLVEEQRLKSSNGDMWQLCISQAERHDTQLAEHWKGKTDTILNFAGLFSIVVSIFLTKAIGDLRPNSTELLLGQISLQLSQSANATFLPVTDILSTRPSNLDVAVDVLWALSLIFSLTCALSASLVQQWIQEYSSYSRCHTVPSTRARIRAYLFEGLSQHRLDQVISAIPSLLHLSLLLFGAGLITSFFSLNDVVAYTALVVYSIVGAVYILLSIAPLIDHSSPFKTPFSSLLWRTLQLIQLTVLYATRCLASCIFPNNIFFRFRLPELINACRERYHGGIVRAIEQDLETRHSNTDVYALRWAISSVQTDHELESFIGAIPRFLDSERHNQYTIGELLEDSSVRLGWSIGRLLKTCASSSCTLDLYTRKRRAVTCARTTWYITEKFAGTKTLYWDTLFGAETAESLKTLGNDIDHTIPLIARCSAALAARSCLRELNEVSAWVQTKGPRWAERALHLIDYINKLSGVPLPAEPETVVRDGPLLILGAFLNGPRSMGQMDDDVSFMVSTTVKYLVEGVGASEASLNAQKQFSEMIFLSGIYDLWTRCLDPATSQALHRAVDSIRQDVEPRVTDGWVDAGFPLPPGCFPPGIIPDRRRPIVPSSYRQWSYDSSGTAFSGDVATSSSSSGVVVSHLPENESSLKTIVQRPIVTKSS
ncbi:hypothetical protein F5888DRAFT_1136181 [Russula emetica]|nr:hypothetical protein F5888DRAFT_1136181 [Russula emetica]